MPDLSKIQSGF